MRIEDEEKAYEFSSAGIFKVIFSHQAVQCPKQLLLTKPSTNPSELLVRWKLADLVRSPYLTAQCIQTFHSQTTTSFLLAEFFSRAFSVFNKVRFKATQNLPSHVLHFFCTGWRVLCENWERMTCAHSVGMSHLLLFLVVFSFATQAYSNLVGIDFGSDSYKVVLAPGAGRKQMQLVFNDGSARKTTTVIGFRNNERLFDSEAVSQVCNSLSSLFEFCMSFSAHNFLTQSFLNLFASCLSSIDS